MRPRQKTFTVFTGIVFFTFLQMRRRRPPPANHDQPAADEKPVTGPSLEQNVMDSAAHSDGRSTVRHCFVAILSRHCVWIIASVALCGAALLIAHLEPHSDLVAVYFPHPFMPGVLLLAAFSISAFLLRKKTFVNYRYAPFVACLAILQLGLLVLYTWRGAFHSGGQPGTAIELAAIGLCGLGVALAVVSTWVGRTSFYEPVAIGLIGLLIGAVSLPGLRFFTRSFSYPDTNGSALLFSTGSADQTLSF